MDDGGTTWILELEEALLDEVPPAQLKVLLAGRALPSSLRTDVWSHCLDVSGRKSKLEKFDDVYDHPDQAQIRQAAQKFSDIQAVSEVESILTVYLKDTGAKFQSKYVDLLTPITRLSLTRNEKYTVFQTILERFVPVESDNSDSALYHLSRLLLLYHDPHLCNHIDSLKINFSDFSTSWFSSLLSGDLSPEISEQLWDLYIVNSDAWLIFFMVITMLVNCRDHILEINNDREELLARLKRLPGQIEAEDVPDLVTLAQVWSARTPSSFKSKYYHTIFTAPDPASEMEVKSILCLPVSPQEVVSSELVNSQFFVVDCRPAEQYNSSHLSSAFHLDCSLMLQDPTQFSTACSALLGFHQTAVLGGQGEHLVFLEEGRGYKRAVSDSICRSLTEQSSEHSKDKYLVEDNMNMAVSRFLQQHTKFTSILEGGFPSLHSNTSSIQTKAPEEKTGGGKPGEPGKLGLLKDNLKTKSENIKSSLLNYIYNPQPHVSHIHRNSKQYKGTGDVFCLDEDEDEEGIRTLEDVKRNVDTVHLADCQRVSETGQLTNCFLLLTRTHLTTLVNGGSEDKLATVSSHHLSTIVKITSKKRQPEVITFKYGTSNKEEVTVFDMDRFFIPTAGKVTSMVKQQIEKLKDS
ncbi:TBC1 domain family member 23 [Eurytemora carolleeae]|uniref:TBC1 domain family member 23 n=1 Tax=Eurytemora carolleeae TaxID=1294199 RepID=UPI000C767974|nr:TBC1 domain family member 23 [Eurytemora carolleeae]|eukprot:XP_023337797.1 TBC1 domain family member 23-like [Eurytemora affinis]